MGVMEVIPAIIRWGQRTTTPTHKHCQDSTKKRTLVKTLFTKIKFRFKLEDM